MTATDDDTPSRRDDGAADPGDAAGPSPYDHVAGDGDALAAGTYRVVGVDDATDDVTLLRVADADGTRVRSGRLWTVAAGTYRSLTAAPNPDADRSIGDRLRSFLVAQGYQARRVGRGLVARPLLGGLAVLVLVAGLVIDAGLLSSVRPTVPELVGDVLVVVGAFAVFLVGSRGAA